MVNQNSSVTLINSCRSQLHHIAPHRNIMWCGAVCRHLWCHERCWYCVGSHRIYISDWPTIHPSISWGLVYAGTWSYPDQYQPIAPVTYTSPKTFIPCYRTNEYYQTKWIFYSVIRISRGKYIPQHLVFNSDRLSRIPTYRIDFTPTVESTSNWTTLKNNWRRRLRCKICLLLASNSMNQLKIINVKL